MRALTKIRRAALAGCIGFLLAIAAASSAFSHSWYPTDCCSDRDCWLMGVEAGAKEPAPIATAAGWRLHDGIVIPYAATRPSPDGRFHVCRYGGAAAGGVIKPPSQLPCLFVPQPGS